MSLLLIILVIGVGIFFIFAELFFIPGFSLFSILGGIIILLGVYLGYKDYGATWGNRLLLISAVATGIILYWGYRRIRSKKWALGTEIDSKVNDESLSAYTVGDTGKTVTNLRPEGKAVFGGEDSVTVFSMGEFIDKNCEVRIARIDHNKIFVKKI